MYHWNKGIALQVMLITLCVVLEQVLNQLITVLSNRNNFLYVVRKDSRERWVTAPSEGGDVTGLKV